MDSSGSGNSPTLRSSSPSTTSTFIPTPSTSASGNTALPGLGQPTPPLPTVPSGPLPVTDLSTTSWRTEYPRIGQFAMTESEEIIAAVPSGLLHFKRVRDHASKPWSEGRLLPDTAMLNDSAVSGLSAFLMRPDNDNSYLCVHCVSGGTLHNFYRCTKDGSSWVKDSHSPFSEHPIGGTPAVAPSDGYYSSRQWPLVVPCQSGGLLHTSTTGPLSSSPYYGERMRWEPVDHVAKDLGIISSVSIALIDPNIIIGQDSLKKTVVVAVCVAGGRLHTVEGEFSQNSSVYYLSSLKWQAQAPTRILHPGEVTGNPTLTRNISGDQLDLLVPSAEGGIFHFVRTASTPDEWHMIARIGFPQGLPAASCLAIHSGAPYKTRQFRALIQSGGRLYYVTTTEGSKPWSGSYLQPVVSPGPFSG
ncbi:hypothetical protein F5Y03DRAFT_362052 [Xylaria venustula]|nr:hypothetical protein F5Y03DRAFT_362052 [Xylaria venustula]